MKIDFNKATFFLDIMIRLSQISTVCFLIKAIQDNNKFGIILNIVTLSFVSIGILIIDRLHLKLRENLLKSVFVELISKLLFKEKEKKKKDEYGS